MSVPSPVFDGRQRHRAASWLLVYGVAGSIILGALFVALVFAAVRLDSALGRLPAARDEVVQILDRTSTALGTAGTTTVSVSDTVTLAQAAVAEASTTVSLFGTTVDGLAKTAEDFGVLGQRPFAGVAAGLHDISASLGRFAGIIGGIATSLDTVSAGVASLGAQLGEVSTAVDASKERLSAIDLDLQGASLVTFGALLVLVVWLEMPALGAIWLGLRWRRRGSAELGLPVDPT